MAKMPSRRLKGVAPVSFLVFKNTNRSPENVSEEAQTMGLLEKDFKTTVLKMLKVLKENRDKGRKLLYFKNENINKNFKLWSSKV